MEDKVLRLAARLGGTISAEHGVGVSKAKHLGLVRSSTELALLRALKDAVDPAGLMNPGAVFAPAEALAARFVRRVASAGRGGLRALLVVVPDRKDEVMEEGSRKGMRRRDFVRTSAAGVAVAGLPLLPASARAEAPPHPPGPPPHPPGPLPKPPETLPKYRTDRAAIDMSRTYANPLNLPNIEVGTNTSAMAPTDVGLGNSAAILPILAKETWVEADGRNLSGRAKANFRALTENRYRTMADFSPVNYDGTILPLLLGQPADQSGAVLHAGLPDLAVPGDEPGSHGTDRGSRGRQVLPGRQQHAVYVADSPAGPWTQLGRFTSPGRINVQRR